MRRAVIKGDIHTSKRDWQEFIHYDPSQFDAIFMEGRDPTDLSYRGADVMYSMFVYGYMFYRHVLHLFYEHVQPGRISMREQVEEWEVWWDYFPYFDAALPEVFEMLDDFETPLLFGLAWIIMGFTVNLLVGPIIDLIPVIGVLFAVLLGTFLVPTYFMIFVFLALDFRGNRRNRFMAREIERVARENGYQNVLIFTGQYHMKYVAQHLRNDGWQVQTVDTQSGSMKTFTGLYQWLAETLGTSGR